MGILNIIMRQLYKYDSIPSPEFVVVSCRGFCLLLHYNLAKADWLIQVWFASLKENVIGIRMTYGHIVNFQIKAEVKI